MKSLLILVAICLLSACPVEGKRLRSGSQMKPRDSGKKKTYNDKDSTQKKNEEFLARNKEAIERIRADQEEMNRRMGGQLIAIELLKKGVSDLTSMVKNLPQDMERQASEEGLEIIGEESEKMLSNIEGNAGGDSGDNAGDNAGDTAEMLMQSEGGQNNAHRIVHGVNNFQIEGNKANQLQPYRAEELQFEKEDDVGCYGCWK